MKRLLFVLSLLIVSQLSYGQYPSSFITSSQSYKPDFESFMQGIKSWTIGDVYYNGQEITGSEVRFGCAYVVEEVTKFLEATIPNASHGVDYRNESTTQLIVDLNIKADYDLNSWSGNWMWNISCVIGFYPASLENYYYSFSVPKVRVVGNQFGDHSLYNKMLESVTRHILYHSYSKELHLKKIKTGWTETSLKNAYSSGIEHPVEGVYEDVNTGGYSNKGQTENKYKLGVKYIDGKLYVIYLDGANLFDDWREGELKASLESTATPYVYKAQWFGNFKQVMDGYVTFDQGIMKTSLNGEISTYIKLYPTVEDVKAESTEWTGTGFALNNGYIVTNYHVVEDAKSITIKGIKGDFNNIFSAEVVATDKYNDLALLKISGAGFNGFGTIPYKIKTSLADVGEDIFVLGYPLTSTMGDEIKLTTGVVSSRTGFQGDVALYQISAPVQPGNSGGPLFDGKGNLIGIVSAKHTGAENVGYAIKVSYLQNLVESSITDNIMPTNNTISTLPLTGKVKNVKSFVFLIECSSK